MVGGSLLYVASGGENCADVIGVAPVLRGGKGGGGENEPTEATGMFQPMDGAPCESGV